MSSPSSSLSYHSRKSRPITNSSRVAIPPTSLTMVSRSAHGSHSSNHNGFTGGHTGHCHSPGCPSSISPKNSSPTVPVRKTEQFSSSFGRRSEHATGMMAGSPLNRMSDFTDVNGIHFPHPRSNSMTIRKPRKTVCEQCEEGSRNIYQAVTKQGGRRRSYTLSGDLSDRGQAREKGILTWKVSWKSVFS